MSHLAHIKKLLRQIKKEIPNQHFFCFQNVKLLKLKIQTDHIIQKNYLRDFDSQKNLIYG